jgi:hypothetical protein
MNKKQILKFNSKCPWEIWMTTVIQDYFHYHGIEDAEIDIEVGYDNIQGDTEWLPACEETFAQQGEPDKQSVGILTKTLLPNRLLMDLKDRITDNAWPYLHHDWYNVGEEFTTPWAQTPNKSCQHPWEIMAKPGYYEIINTLCYCS